MRLIHSLPKDIPRRKNFPIGWEMCEVKERKVNLFLLSIPWFSKKRIIAEAYYDPVMDEFAHCSVAHEQDFIRAYTTRALSLSIIVHSENNEIRDNLEKKLWR